VCDWLCLNHLRNLTKHPWLDTLPGCPDGGGARAHEKDSPLGSDIQLLAEKSNDQHLGVSQEFAILKTLPTRFFHSVNSNRVPNSVPASMPGRGLTWGKKSNKEILRYFCFTFSLPSVG